MPQAFKGSNSQVVYGAGVLLRFGHEVKLIPTMDCTESILWLRDELDIATERKLQEKMILAMGEELEPCSEGPY